MSNHAFIKLFKNMSVQMNVPLAPFSTLKIGGPARYFVVVNDVHDIALIQKIIQDHDVKLHILSGGSNTLFSDDGFDGVVVKLGPAFDYIKPAANNLSLEVGAATSFAKTTKLAISFGWEKAVGWSGTPGLLGGAIRMNAGTRMGEIKDAIATVYGIKDGQIIAYEKSNINFGYRCNDLPDDLLIFKACLAYDKNLLKPAQELLTRVQEYRLKRRATQPTINSLGSFFKNPYPSFAAQLIEKCNLKGLQYKGAQISPLHANFIINNGGASANDILYIGSIAQRAVFDRFGVVLSPEIRMVGNFMSENSLCNKSLALQPNVNTEY